MPDVIGQVTLKAGGVYHPPGSVVTIEDPEEAKDLVDRGFAEWAGESASGPEIPSGFPHRDILADAGITSIEDVPDTEEGLTDIPGIGKGRAKDILAAMGD